MIYYVLLTHGAKPTGKIGNHPAARQQIANLRAYLDALPVGTTPRPVLYDYARKITGLSSTPTLLSALEQISTAGQGAVLMDNIGRLFAACDKDHRKDLMTELLVYGDQFLGLQQRERLSKLPEFYLDLLRLGVIGAQFTISGTRPRSRLSKSERKLQTADATLASRIARGQAADEKARHLDTIRSELARKHETPTFRMIAEEANSRGITTTRGGTWSSSTVGRSLGRLDISPQTETLNASPTQDQDQE